MLSEAQKRKKIKEHKLKDSTLPNVDSFLFFINSNTSIILPSQKLHILHPKLKKVSNNDTEIIENNKLEKQFAIICIKEYPTDIANFMQILNLSIEDKEFIVEYGPL